MSIQSEIAKEYNDQGGSVDMSGNIDADNVVAALLTMAVQLKSLTYTLQRLEEKFYGKS